MKGMNTMYKFIIQYINNYGHIVKELLFAGTEKQVINAAKKDKFLYPECYIEIINTETFKSIYA